MTSMRLKSLEPKLTPGTWRIEISLTNQPPQYATLTIKSINPEGLFTGYITIDGVEHFLDIGVIKDGSVMFRPGSLGILSANPLFYLFAGQVQEYLPEMKGRVIVPSLIPRASHKLKSKHVNPDEDAGLEGSWTATRPPEDESKRK